MLIPDRLECLFVLSAFLFQLVLIIHFALRRWRFELAIRYGPFVYALSIPAAILSIVLLTGGRNWVFWLGGFLYLAWAVFGFTVEYILKIEWRAPIRWPVFIPYICLYLATAMFYWWPLLLVYKPLWYAYAGLYVISTVLNLKSHKKQGAMQ
jgi:hypothetical protein